MSNVQQGMSNVQETCSKTYFYYPVTPLACHPFINEGEVAMLPDAHFFPFIDEGVGFPFGAHTAKQDGVVEKISPASRLGQWQVLEQV